jgi:hypothetical protein
MVFLMLKKWIPVIGRALYLDEKDSWYDLQRLDHLEYKRDELLKLLEVLS